VRAGVSRLFPIGVRHEARLGPRGRVAGDRRPIAAAAEDDEDAEFWLNPSISADLDDDTGVELEFAHRFRDAGNGRSDTHFARLWLNQDVADGVKVAGAIERRINTDGDADETRIIQQLSTSRGLLRTRLRFEQRFLEDADRVGLRLRPRVGLSVPLDAGKRWRFNSDAELFVTLRSTSEGGDHGVTGLRTQIGFSYEVSERFSVSAGYLRQESFNDSRPDVVGHAPIIGLEYSY
jgi:hypothetical protein